MSLVFFDALEHLTNGEIQALPQETYRISNAWMHHHHKSAKLSITCGSCEPICRSDNISALFGPIVKALLADAGFQNIQIREAHLQPSVNSLNRALRLLSTPLIYIFEALYRLTWSVRQTPLSSNVIIVANK